MYTHILTNAHTLALYPNLTSIKHILGLSVPEVVPFINCISHKWAHSEMKISILEEKFKKYRTFHSLTSATHNPVHSFQLSIMD
jgi:hypothetical protein